MHTSSFNTMAGLMGAICLGPLAGRPRDSIQVLDVGSCVANAQARSYKQIAQKIGVSYTGLDVSAGENVDVVAEEPYNFPLQSERFDLVISGQAFEHIEFPWLTIQEMSRVLKPGGYAIVIAPSSGPQHRFPQDCWRFYPDGMRALAKWAVLDEVLCTTFWGETEIHLWGDTVAVLQKPGPSAVARFAVTEADIAQMRGYSPMRSAVIRGLGLLFRTLNPLRDRWIS